MVLGRDSDIAKRQGFLVQTQAFHHGWRTPNSSFGCGSCRSCHLRLCTRHQPTPQRAASLGLPSLRLQSSPSSWLCLAQRLQAEAYLASPPGWCPEISDSPDSSATSYQLTLDKKPPLGLPRPRPSAYDTSFPLGARPVAWLIPLVLLFIYLWFLR